MCGVVFGCFVVCCWVYRRGCLVDGFFCGCLVCCEFFDECVVWCYVCLVC